MSRKPQEIYLKSVLPMMPYSSNIRTPYVAVSSLSVFSLLCRSSLDLCSGFSSNSIYQPLFEHWVHVWQGPGFIQKILENFAVCRALVILSDLCEVRLSFLVRIPRLNSRWILRRNNVGNAQRDDVRKSYEFTLNHVGQDKDSGEIWSDYIQFLQSGEVRYLSRPSSGSSNTR